MPDPDYPDFDSIPGFHGQEFSVPDQYVPETRKWSIHRCDHAFFGGMVRTADTYRCGPPYPCTDARGRTFEPGFAELLSLHPMRAMDLVGRTESIPQPPFDSTVEVSPFFYGYPAEITWTDMPMPGGDATLQITALADVDWSNEYATLYLNGILIGDVFRHFPPDIIGSCSQNSRANRVIPQAQLTEMLDITGGQLNLDLVPNSNMSHCAGGFCRVNIEYEGGAVEREMFALEELCHPHVGYGCALNDEGFLIPYTMTAPDQYEPAELSVGAFIPCPADHPEGLGEPGFFIAAMPVPLPKVNESIFASHRLLCGVPIGVP